MTIEVSTSKLIRVLFLIAIALILLNIVGRAYVNLGGDNNIGTELVNVDHERSIPTFYSHTILLFSALLLMVIAHLSSKTNRNRVGWWWVLSGIFVFLALDEALVLHEHLITDSLSWTVPYGVLVVIMGISFRRFLLDLPTSSRNQFIIAGIIYVFGAIGMEIPAGQIYEARGGGSVYALLTTIEESLEIFGVLIFIDALLTYLHHEFGSIRLVLVPDRANAPQASAAMAVKQ
jgi:hypothetical protein